MGTGAITIAGCVAMALLGVAFAIVRPWHAERELGRIGGHPLVLHLRGNALGSHCELEDASVPDSAIPFACGVTMRGPDWGPGEVFRTEGRETCLVEVSPLRQVACVPRWVEWMVVRSDSVAIAQVEGAVQRITEIDRATGVARRFDVPTAAYLVNARGGPAPTFRVDGSPTRMFRLVPGGFAELSL